jgi:hypothetical protein
MKSFLAIIGLVICGSVFAADPTGDDVYQVRLQISTGAPSELQQANLRAASSWNVWADSHSGWRAIMSDRTGLPHRAWGTSIVVDGTDLETKHNHFVADVLSTFGVLPEHLSDDIVSNRSGKHDRFFQGQTVSGYPVLQSVIQTKWKSGKLLMWGLDWWPDATVPEGDVLSDSEVLNSAIDGLPFESTEITWDGWGILPDSYAEGEFRLVRKLKVKGKIDGLLRNYETWVDAITGRVWYRNNMIVHHVGKKITIPMGFIVKSEVVAEESEVTCESDADLLVISGVTNAMAHPMYPYDTAEELAMPHLKMVLSGDTYYSDANGGFITNINSGLNSVNVKLEGRWCKIFTDGLTPSSLLTFQNGYNVLNVAGNVKEASAYRSVNLIHDHMNEWLPDFTGLDFAMTTNIDVEGECNAFFDGGSINFYDTGGGCNPTSLIADVVHHEYGHGINSYFYNSLGANFNNGAMGEGYADFWAMSLADIAEIGKGFYEENNDGIRRYDLEPKVYPQDLVGEVHADGEIIAGAWYDTHLLMGGDWDATLELFVEVYPGLQATATNGDEGQAFTDVLIDVLQADDDDGNLFNGTPNAPAIIEGFEIHGITVFSYLTVDHSPVEFAEAEASIEIQAVVDFDLQSLAYYGGVFLSYRTLTSDPWLEVEMFAGQQGYWSADIPSQPAGTVVEYFIHIQDVFGGISSVTPMVSNIESNANLPYYIIVGSYQYLVNDSDDYSDLGNWELGDSGDNATTGEWEETIPVGSYGEVGNPNSVVAAPMDHTVGFGGYCFLTGVSPGADAGIGENDVDGGHTTLLSPVIDLTIYDNPVLEYWRWYVNAPPTGANPGADWWQVEITNDGGSSWQYVENTSQQDARWRRKAFRVLDHMDLTSEFQIRFIASDSTTVGEYLDGGSLVEAALDDIILYDVVPPDDAVYDSDPTITPVIMPNPASSSAYIENLLSSTPVRVYNNIGTLVCEGLSSASGNITIDVAGLSSGIYNVESLDQKARRVILKLEVLR